MSDDMLLKCFIRTPNEIKNVFNYFNFMSCIWDYTVHIYLFDFNSAFFGETQVLLQAIMTIE